MTYSNLLITFWIYIKILCTPKRKSKPSHRLKIYLFSLILSSWLQANNYFSHAYSCFGYLFRSTIKNKGRALLMIHTNENMSLYHSTFIRFTLWVQQQNTHMVSLTIFIPCFSVKLLVFISWHRFFVFTIWHRIRINVTLTFASRSKQKSYYIIVYS